MQWQIKSHSNHSTQILAIDQNRGMCKIIPNKIVRQGISTK